MKFGGASVASPQRFLSIAHLIRQKKEEFSRIVVVVSAMGDTTDELIALAKQVHPDPPRREHDMLVSVGERISISLLAMALAQQEQDAVSFTGSQSGIITSPEHADAKITNVKPHRIVQNLDKNRIVIVAGFQGVSTEGEITTLGRGGSDTTAVALGAALSAEKVEFYKDVKGVYDADPKIDPKARFHASLSYDGALEILERGSGVLHRRSVLLAKKNGIPLVLGSFSDADPLHGATVICDPDRPRPQAPVFEN